mmetsp:Transcript_16230/g.44920  ORF Transcript_16230/g.44920 Transcript_16230/m.44920 type:complete len:434 (+) Transcript_16230:159-1460(+)
MDKQGDLQGEAVAAEKAKEFQKAVDLLTECIKIGNPTAKMYAKRGQNLLKMKRPMACIADCDSAIAINQNNAAAFRVRGLANRYSGRWEQAQMDLSKGMQLDFDAFEDDADATKAKKIVAEKYEKLKDKQVQKRLKDEKKKVDDTRRRKEEAQRVYEEQKRQDAAGFGGGGFGAPPPAAPAAAQPSSYGHHRPQTHSGQGLPVSSRIFCGGLPQTCDDAKLHTYFSRFGVLTDAKVMQDRATNRSRGFGYVSFADAHTCEVTLAQGSHIMDDKIIEVKRCEERGSAVLQGRQFGGALAPAQQFGGGAPPPQQLALPAFSAPSFALAPSFAPAVQAPTSGGDLLSQLLSSLGPSLSQPGGVPDVGTLTAQLTTVLQNSQNSGGGGVDLLGEVTKLLQDPQALLQAILMPVVSQLTGALQGGGAGQGNGSRFSPY